MREQKKQNILTAIIIILVIALFLMIGSIVYEERINMSKQASQNVNLPSIKEEYNEDEIETTENDNVLIEEEEEIEKENEENPVEEPKDEEYVGEEENITEEKPEVSTDQKVIDLVKKEWGKDSNAIFSIEKKNGTKYRVAVRDSSTTVLAWYEVDTQTWEVSEY